MIPRTFSFWSFILFCSFNIVIWWSFFVLTSRSVNIDLSIQRAGWFCFLKQSHRKPSGQPAQVTPLPDFLSTVVWPLHWLFPDISLAPVTLPHFSYRMCLSLLQHLRGFEPLCPRNFKLGNLRGWWRFSGKHNREIRIEDKNGSCQFEKLYNFPLPFHLLKPYRVPFHYFFQNMASFSLIIATCVYIHTCIPKYMNTAYSEMQHYLYGRFRGWCLYQISSWHALPHRSFPAPCSQHALVA